MPPRESLLRRRDVSPPTNEAPAALAFRFRHALSELAGHPCTRTASVGGSRGSRAGDRADRMQRGKAAAVPHWWSSSSQFHRRFFRLTLFRATATNLQGISRVFRVELDRLELLVFQKSSQARFNSLLARQAGTSSHTNGTPTEAFSNEAFTAAPQAVGAPL